MLSGSHTFRECHHNILHLHLHSPLHPQRRSAFSLFLPLFCPSLAPTIPAPRLPASLQPSPLPLPRSSIVSAWFSSLSLSCSTQPCLAFLLCSPSQTQRTQPPRLGSGEGKGSTSNCRSSQENKAAALTPELIYTRLCESERSLTSIDLFLHS